MARISPTLYARIVGLTLVLIAACSSSSSPGEARPDASGPGASGAPGYPEAPAPPLPPVGSGLGAASFASGELDAASNGGTITFQNIGAAGWYARVRDPAVGACDVSQTSTCCRGKHDIASDALTPWDEDLVMTLRGPLTVKQLAVYQPSGASGGWSLVSAWDERTKSAAAGLAFEGNATDGAPFGGAVGSECLVNVSSALPFACGPGSDPYCPAPQGGKTWHRGFAGSKLFVVLARMPHATEIANACSKGATTGNWYDAPWVGLSVGELVRAGSFSSCQCYAKDAAKGYLGDGCGQFNVFEVVNDNNSFKNLDVFSTNFIGYAGYVGEGPCGSKCNPAAWPAALDLVDKSKNVEASAGAVASPTKGPGAAFRRPVAGYRYFLVGLDVAKRSVQLGVVHPQHVPAALAPILPALPATLDAAAIDALFTVRLPN